MKLTAKARYAVMAITDIAVNGKDRAAVSLSDISIRQDISLSFLEQLFGKLRRAGLVESQRGAMGGYNLTRPTSDIYIGEIMRAVDEEIQTKRCGDNGIGCTTKARNASRMIYGKQWKTILKAFLTPLPSKMFLIKNSRKFALSLSRQQNNVVFRS